MFKLYQKFEILKELLVKSSSIIRCKVLFNLNNIKYASFSSLGVPNVKLSKTGYFEIGNSFVMVNLAKYATLGKSNRCKFVVGDHAKLIIGNNVGMSNCTIVSYNSVKLGNNLLIGGGVTIVDTDFHSLNPKHWHTEEDVIEMKSRPVEIGDNVFIGMDSIILKGVSIGSNVIIGAGSVVSKDIPKNQVWGGNPALFIKNNP